MRTILSSKSYGKKTKLNPFEFQNLIPKQKDIQNGQRHSLAGYLKKKLYLTCLEPATDAVEVESMVTHTPSNLNQIKMLTFFIKILKDRMDRNIHRF